MSIEAKIVVMYNRSERMCIMYMRVFYDVCMCERSFVWVTKQMKKIKEVVKKNGSIFIKRGREN